MYDSDEVTWDRSPRRSLDPLAMDISAILAEVPKYDFEIAKGGETTYDLDMDALGSVEHAIGFLTRWSRRDFKVKKVTRIAVAGEHLRGPNLKLKMNTDRNVVYRAMLRHKCMDNLAYQKLQMQLCKWDPIYFMRAWVWIEDPRRAGDKRIPLVPFEIQERLVYWALEMILSEDIGLCEKSRDMGASWVLEALSVWMVLFHADVKVFQMSMTEDDVGKRTTNSMLGKCRFILSGLPEWMRQGWVEYGSDLDSKMLLKFPGTEKADHRAEIEGVLSNASAGRSGRCTLMNWDEAAHCEEDVSVTTALSSLAASVLIYSSVNGSGNEFARMARDPDTNKIRLHWSDHPLKDAKWALMERSKTSYTDEKWAQEHEIEYETSTSGRVFPQFISKSNSPLQWSHVRPATDPWVQYDPRFGVWVFADLGITDVTSIWYGQIKPGARNFEHVHESLAIFAGEEDSGLTVAQWSDRILGKPWGNNLVGMVGDPRTLSKTSFQTGRPTIDAFAQHGVHFKTPKHNSEQQTLLEMQRVLEEPGKFGIHESDCKQLVRSLQSWSYPTDKNKDVVPGSKPKHDGNSHACKALLYGVDFVFGGKSKLHQAAGLDEWDFRRMGHKRFN